MSTSPAQHHSHDQDPDIVGQVDPGDAHSDDTNDEIVEDEDELEGEEDDKPELGHLAQWTVSSHKYGFGVENLRDDNENTFWQSEGPQPHLIDLSFPKRVMVTSIALQTSHPRDDSYTPSKIAVLAGTGVHDLQEVHVEEFEKPDGWINIPLRQGQDAEGAIPCHHLRVLIIANHLNGKDTHVRGMKVFGASASAGASGQERQHGDREAETGKHSEGRALLELGHDGSSGFITPAFRMHEHIR